MCKQNFKGKKVVRVMNGMMTRLLEITKNDLKTKEDPDVIVKSKNEETKKNKDIANMILSILPMLPQGYGQIYGARKALVMLGIDEDESRLFVQETGAEIEARSQLVLLNKNTDLNPVSDIQEDHDAYICIYRQAIDTPAKFKAIKNRLMAKIEKEKQNRAMDMQMAQQQAAGIAPSQPTNPNAGPAATASNMLMSSALQKPKAITTARDVQPVQK